MYIWSDWWEVCEICVLIQKNTWTISDILVYFDLQQLEFVIISALIDVLIYEWAHVHLFFEESLFGLFCGFFCLMRILLQGANHVLLLRLLANALCLARKLSILLLQALMLGKKHVIFVKHAVELFLLLQIFIHLIFQLICQLFESLLQLFDLWLLKVKELHLALISPQSG